MAVAATEQCHGASLTSLPWKPRQRVMGSAGGVGSGHIGARWGIKFNNLDMFCSKMGSENRTTYLDEMRRREERWREGEAGKVELGESKGMKEEKQTDR